MRVLFLDIDGVLNHAAEFALDAGRVGTDLVSSVCLEALMFALGCSLETRLARIVISSTWRLDPRNLRTIATVLRSHGLEIEDVTPYLGGTGSRGSEIAAWLSAHPDVAGYVIVDDSPEAFFGHPPERCVQTFFDAGGLTWRAAHELRAKLQDQPA